MRRLGLEKSNDTTELSKEHALAEYEDEASWGGGGGPLDEPSRGNEVFVEEGTVVSKVLDRTEKPSAAFGKPGSASVRDVFSFARTRKMKLFIGGAIVSALVSGATMPGKYTARGVGSYAGALHSSIHFGCGSLGACTFSFYSHGILLRRRLRGTRRLDRFR